MQVTRQDVWCAMSELFLDTKLDIARLARIEQTAYAQEGAVWQQPYTFT